MAQDILLYPSNLKNNNAGVTNDLQIVNGDFVIGESSDQEANLIINSFQNNWFQFPTCGVGILQYLSSTESAIYIETQIKNQLIQDGFVVDSIKMGNISLELNTIDISLIAHRP